MKQQYQYAYHISPGYSLLTIWVISGRTRVRINSLTFKQNAALTRKTRHSCICAQLEEFGIPLPLYVPTKGGK